MNDAVLFLMFVAFFVLPFVLGAISKWHELEEKQQSPYTDYRITIEPVVITPKSITNTTTDITKEAKDILVVCGFTASEAKNLINEAGPCKTVDDLVQAALMRAKI